MKKLGFLLIALILGVGFICVLTLTSATSAVSPAEDKAAIFYRGKTVEFVVPYDPGGNIDTAARLVSPFLAKHLGATVIVRNEPGAGAKVALNRLAKETNGLSLVTCATRAAAVAQVFGDSGARFDLAKFNWLGTITKDQYPVVVGKKSGYKSIADLQQAKEVKFGADTRTSGKAIRPLVMGYLLGINVKVIAGYKGSADDILALQRGETDGLSTSLQGVLSYIKSQDLLPLLVMGREHIKLLPDIPTIFEVKKLSVQEQKIADISIALDDIGLPVATTPGVPKERVAFLESALKKALAEPELLERFKKMGGTIDYVTGKGTAETINTMLSISENEKVILGKILGVKGY